MQTHFANIKKIVHGAIANNLTKVIPLSLLQYGHISKSNVALVQI
jgi:hypothetical protein